MFRLKLIAVLLLLNGFTGLLYAQNFQWIKAFGNANKASYRIINVSAEVDGGSTILLENSTGKADTMRLGSYSFIKPSNNWQYVLVKLDSSKNIVKARLIYNDKGGFSYVYMQGDGNGNCYINFTINLNHVFDSVKLNGGDGHLVFVKYNNDMKRMWIKQTSDVRAQPRNLAFSQGHLFFICSTPYSTLFDTTFFVFHYETYVYGEIDPSSGALLWVNFLPGSNYIKDMQYLQGRIFVFGSANYSVMGSDTFGNGPFIIQTDSVGKYKKKIIGQKVKTYTYIKVISPLAFISDGVYLYVSALVHDTIQFAGKTYPPQHPLGGGYFNETVILSYTMDGRERWLFRPKLLDTTEAQDIWLDKATTNEGYMYFGGTLYSSILIDSNVLSPTTKWQRDIILLKIDYMGNVLWATNGGASTAYTKTTGLDAIAGKCIYLSGNFDDELTFGRHKETAKGHLDGWLLKISDNSIYRGNVYAGPYCAGDSIEIPYTKSGEFDTSNYFIAQLSDEYGNFEEKYLELGRIKSNQNGTIIGKIPSFQVKSSAMYRIRIISTIPAVQSFYRIDTLRLLIYSRDKADPGPTEAICYGDSIKLNTYGGTKWTWSPKYNMDNPALRSPTVWPTKDTTYQIIIADSSGCGEADTAYKKITIRNYPKAFLAFDDTLICENTFVKIPARFEKGDSNYHWQWVEGNSVISSGQMKNADTLNYKSKTTVKTTVKLALVLNDGCNVKPDTAFASIHLVMPDTIKTFYRDTTLCTGKTIKYNATNSGSFSKTAQWQWKDLTGDRILSKTDSLSFTADKTCKIQLTLNNGCAEDTRLFTINVKPPLKVITNLRDTAVCYGQNIDLFATGKGGDSKNYDYSWMLDNKLISSTKDLKLTSSYFSNKASTSTLILILKDNCSIPNDTIKKIIAIKPSPKAEFKFSTACNIVPIQFNFTGTKPGSPLTTSFKWNFAGIATSTIENPSQLLSTIGKKKITLTTSSSNGCSDTITKDVDVRQQSKADFSVNDACESDSAVFKNLSKDATSYNWKFGDGQNSKSKAPKHKYQITSTTTFNVMLVAIVADGCSDSVGKAITINQNPDADFTATQNGTKLELKAKAGYTNYRWKFDMKDSVSTSASNYTHSLKTWNPITICLKTLDLNGCYTETCKTIPLGISNITKPSGFKIYPNPNTGNFTVEIENPSNDVSIEVYNVIGEKVGRVEKVGKVNSLDLDISAGIYLVRVKNGNEEWNQKVVVR